MCEVDFIIVTYNQSRFTKLCIESILKHIDQPYHLIVVDNGSVDDTLSYLDSIKSRIPSGSRLSVISSGDNSGYAGGLNKGLDHSRGKYVLLCNNDIEFYPRSLREMIRVAESNDQFGLVNPNSNEFEMKSFDPKALAGLQGRHIERCHTSGFCVLVKRAVIDKIGGIDLAFSPAYFEDMDFAERAKKAGYLCVVALGGYVYHYGTRTFLSDEKERLWQRNEKLFRARWGGTQWFGFAGDSEILESDEKRRLIIDALLNLARREIAIINIYVPSSFAHYFENLHHSFRIYKTLPGCSELMLILRALKTGTKRLSRSYFGSDRRSFAWKILPQLRSIKTVKLPESAKLTH